MEIRQLIKALYPLRSFIYKRATFDIYRRMIIIPIVARKNSKGICSVCHKKAPTYDTQKRRNYEHVPLWGLRVSFAYRPRRVKCQTCGVKIEEVPWASGKFRQTRIMKQFLSHWAKKLAWKQVAVSFNTSWNRVRDAVQWTVEYGLANRSLEGVKNIGVDEIQSWRGHKYLTMVYQIDAGCKRLLWLGMGRSEKTLENFALKFGKDFCDKIEHVCSDMWKPYLKVIRSYFSNALNILDRFHIVSNLNKAVDTVRREESNRLRKDKEENVIKGTRFLWIRNKENLTTTQFSSLKALLRLNMNIVKAYLFKENFNNFWEYQKPKWAERFLGRWCDEVMDSGIEPMMDFAKSILKHKSLIMNWYASKKMFSSGVVEAINNTAKVTMRIAYGYKTFDTLEIALFHSIGRLPEPEITHRFW